MIRRLFKTGNSIVLSLPREALESLNLRDGAAISLELDRAQRRIIITPLENPLAAGVDEDYARQVADFITRYRPALEELAK